MSEERFIELATKYLSNEASKEETASLYSYLEQDEYYTLFSQIKEKWNDNIGNNQQPVFDLEKSLNLLETKIKAVEPAFRINKKPITDNLFSKNPIFVKIAASIAFFLVLTTAAIYFSGILETKKSVIAWYERTTKMGEKSIVTLLDGTSITLNADSKLKYPRKFDGTTREVVLEGEAFFEVAHDPSHPFIVHAANISTTVLGTRFNVSAFNNDGEISVSLVEGSVKVATDNAQKGVVVLSPTQQLVYDKENETSKVELFNNQEAVGWKNNILVFKDETLEKVFVVLERTYGVKFELADKSLKKKRIKADFKNESLWTVVEVLKRATGLESKSVLENNEVKKIVFYKK